MSLFLDVIGHEPEVRRYLYSLLYTIYFDDEKLTGKHSFIFLINLQNSLQFHLTCFIRG